MGHLWKSMLNSYLRFEHHIAAAFFLGGFVVDIILFTHIDYLLKHAILCFYLFLSGGSILWYQWLTRARGADAPTSVMKIVLPFVIQFSFGGIMSGLFIYFARSASLIQSWMFLALFLFALVGNEFIRERYQRLEFQVIVFFFSVYAFAIVIVPYVHKEITNLMFLESGAWSILVMVGFCLLLRALNPTTFQISKNILFIGVTSITILLNALYFTNIIPPIPLVLSQPGIFHSITRSADGNYIGVNEPAARLATFLPFRTHYHVDPTGTATFFSAILAPATLSAPISHEWQYQDPITGDWTTKMRITFPITGGRADGYRTYSIKESVTLGKWRIHVKTGDGRAIGTFTFTAVAGDPSTLLSSRL